MSVVTIILYVLALALWGYLVRRDGGIGIGIRFLYALNIIVLFLTGPMLVEIFGHDRQPRLSTWETSVQLSLYAFLAYVTGSYVGYPALVGRFRLIPKGFAERMADPARLDAQWKVAWALVWIGVASLPLYQVVRFIPSIGAVYNQGPLMIDSGLVMLSLYAAYGRRKGVFAAVFGVLLVKGVVYSSMSGPAGGIFINGMFLACLALFSLRIRYTNVAVLILVGLVAFIPAQMWLQGRGELRQAIQDGAEFEKRVEITLDIFSNLPSWLEKDQSMVSTYRDRGDYSHLLAAAVAHTPAIQPYAEGETLLNFFIAIIPRLFWPDKPYVLGGNEFVSKYTGMTFGRTTSVGMHHLFELYVNFGPFGVAIGMFVIGLLVAWMESIYYGKGVNNLFWESCVILCSWYVCIYSDKVADLAMLLIPAIASCVIICTALRFYLRSRFLPSFFGRSKSRASAAPTTLGGQGKARRDRIL